MQEENQLDIYKRSERVELGITSGLEYVHPKALKSVP